MLKCLVTVLLFSFFDFLPACSASEDGAELACRLNLLSLVSVGDCSSSSCSQELAPAGFGSSPLVGPRGDVKSVSSENSRNESTGNTSVFSFITQIITTAESTPSVIDMDSGGNDSLYPFSLRSLELSQGMLDSAAFGCDFFRHRTNRSMFGDAAGRRQELPSYGPIYSSISARRARNLSPDDGRHNLGRIHSNAKQGPMIVEITPGHRCPSDMVPPSLRGEDCRIILNGDSSDDDLPQPPR
ncbi:MAG: hypothetical protein NTX76_01665 [Alphaproteobacteria bacterium]|nr:hypothetical protein [Alphaproteobacteria bacterium]